MEADRKLKMSKLMATLTTVERSFMIPGMTSVPEKNLPSKLKNNQSFIHRAHLTFGLVSFASFICSLMCFVLFKAKTFSNYVECATFLVGALIIFTFYAGFAWQSAKLSDSLTDLKGTVEQSESKTVSFNYILTFLWSSLFNAFRELKYFLKHFQRMPKPRGA